MRLMPAAVLGVTLLYPLEAGYWLLRSCYEFVKQIRVTQTYTPLESCQNKVCDILV
jgi:hypothetical protein